MQRTQRGEAALKEGPNREIRQRRENAEIQTAVFRIFGVFRGSVLREILAGCEQLWLLQCRERKNLDLKKFVNEGTGDTNWHEFDTNLRKKTGRIKCRERSAAKPQSKKDRTAKYAKDAKMQKFGLLFFAYLAYFAVQFFGRSS